MAVRRVQIIDSHTGGEPTRVVIAGGPDLGSGSLSDRRARFQSEHDDFRSAVVNEPRGSDVLVGALLTPPFDPRCVAGVIFFNNVGMLHMCGHGTIGLAVTLAHMGKIQPGKHLLDTPVGVVGFDYQGGESVEIENVPSYRFRTQVPVEVEGHGIVHGDIAWCGNWFFLISDHGQDLSYSRAVQLTDFTQRVRAGLERQGITGAEGGLIDHIELFGPPTKPAAQSRNFVLCPGGAYDRSPCGTGTSAKLACLYADGKLREGETWRQESIVGSIFEGRIRVAGDKVIPLIRGTAFVNAEATLLLDSADPFQMGLRA
ncbi:4-hydroxyproline epimerase [soil metagenome]